MQKGLGEVTSDEVDLEEVMLSLGEEGDLEGYGRKYTKTHEKRAKHSMSRVER